MNIEIEHNVARPKRMSNKRIIVTDALAAMEIDDSVAIPEGAISIFRSVAAEFKREGVKKFTIRNDKKGALRIWRTL